MEKKECPFCGEMIAANAQKCRFCGEWIVDVENDDANDIEDDADEDEEQPDEEVYTGTDDPQEHAKSDKEMRKFRKTLFSQIADLIVRHGGEAYWYQIFEKYEIGIFTLIAFIISLLFLPVSLLAVKLNCLLFDLSFDPTSIIVLYIFMFVISLMFAASPLINYKKDVDQEESSMLIGSVGAWIVQFIFLTFPVVFVIIPWIEKHWEVSILFTRWGILYILLYVLYICYYNWIRRETNAYKLWIYNIACENYDFLHSNRFRYWNSRAAQDADIVNLRHLSGFRFISLRCMLLAPATLVMDTFVLMLL